MLNAISRAVPRVLIPGHLAIAGALLALSPVSAQAASANGVSATLQAPLAAPRQEILDGSLWKCAGDSCTTREAGSRPVLICQRVAKKFGPVASFATPTGELSEQELARCNGR